MNKVYVVGLGPGGSRWMTWEARAALEQAEVLCGYTVYLDLIRGEFPDKEYFSTPMTQEIERCRAALERAEREGRAVWLGDDLPRSFILVGDGNAPPTVYISQLSPATLLRRMENNSFE